MTQLVRKKEGAYHRMRCALFPYEFLVATSMILRVRKSYGNSLCDSYGIRIANRELRRSLYGSSEQLIRRKSSSVLKTRNSVSEDVRNSHKRRLGTQFFNPYDFFAYTAYISFQTMTTQLREKVAAQCNRVFLSQVSFHKNSFSVADSRLLGKNLSCQGKTTGFLGKATVPGS